MWRLQVPPERRWRAFEAAPLAAWPPTVRRAAREAAETRVVAVVASVLSQLGRRLLLLEIGDAVALPAGRRKRRFRADGRTGGTAVRPREVENVTVSVVTVRRGESCSD